MDASETLKHRQIDPASAEKGTVLTHTNLQAILVSSAYMYHLVILLIVPQPLKPGSSTWQKENDWRKFDKRSVNDTELFTRATPLVRTVYTCVCDILF